MAHIAARGRFEHSRGTLPRVSFDRATPHPLFSSFSECISGGRIRALSRFVARFHVDEDPPLSLTLVP